MILCIRKVYGKNLETNVFTSPQNPPTSLCRIKFADPPLNAQKDAL